MSIGAPTIQSKGIAGGGIQIYHTPPTAFAAPSTSWVRSQIFVRELLTGITAPPVAVTAPGMTVVTLTGLVIDRTYEIEAVAISDAGEISAMSAELTITYTLSGTTGVLEPFYNQLDDLDPNTALTTPHAFAKFLDAVGYRLLDTNLLLGTNLFVEVLPKWYYQQDSSYRRNPTATLALIQNDSQQSLSLNQRFRAKTVSLIRVSMFDGRADRANFEAAKLHQFLLRRENASFTVDVLSVRDIVPLEEPRLAGVEDSGVSQFSFRCECKVVYTCAS